MAKVRVKLNRSGVKALLKSAEMKAVCEEHANAVKARCGDGYESDAHFTKERVIVNVWPSSAKARQDNARNNTILKALK